jgi:hypothetical protein
MTRIEPEYVSARSVLLDALGALGVQRDAVILVGAQAVYLHAGEADLATAPMTTDADLTVDVERVATTPALAAAMRAGGFELAAQPGSWKGRFGVLVDLMVAPHQGGRTSRKARGGDIPQHGRNVVRIAAGLEPALIDHEEREVVALDPADERRYRIEVAGPAALLVAKLTKLEERFAEEDAGRKSRVLGKDALDVVRLLRGVKVDKFAHGFDRHARQRYAGPVSKRALAFLRQEARDERTRLVGLVAEASGGDRTLPPSFVALAQELLERCAHTVVRS